MIWNTHEGMKEHMRRHCNLFWMLSTFRLFLVQAAQIHGAPKIDGLCLPFLRLKPTLKRSAGCACEEKVLEVSLETFSFANWPFSYFDKKIRSVRCWDASCCSSFQAPEEEGVEGLHRVRSHSLKYARVCRNCFKVLQISFAGLAVSIPGDPKVKCKEHTANQSWRHVTCTWMYSKTHRWNQSVSNVAIFGEKQ